MSIILANFGKYAISDCPFITCQNLHFGKYVRLTVCLFVCLSVCNVNNTGRTVEAINIKLGTYMYLVSGYMCILFGVDDVTDDVMRPKSRSNFKNRVTPLIFELERRSKAPNVGKDMAYSLQDSTSGTTSGLKVRTDFKMAAILKVSNYFR